MDTATPRDPAIQLLLDKQEIHEVLMRYCRGVDRCDEDLIRSTFYQDAYDNHGRLRGNAWEFAKKVIPVLGQYKSTNHFIANELVDVQGDVAHSEAYVIAYHRLIREGREYDIVFGGRYVDRLERRHGVWKIARRVLVHDWSRVDPVVETWDAGPHFVQGQHSRDDTIYQQF